MWSDSETTNDLVGFQVHADLIRAVLTTPGMLPITVGIFGDWGGGKTSIMKMIERDLDPERWPAGSEDHKGCESLAVVYVNTWLYEGYDDAKAAILSSILLELAEHKRFGPKVRDAVVSLLKSVNWMRVVRMAVKAAPLAGAAVASHGGGAHALPWASLLSSGVEGILPSADSGAENKADGNLFQAPDLRTFRQRFGKMLSDGGISTLVVLVDDLDRCTPERIIENLEAIKLFLSVEQTAFVVGADRRIVEHAIRSRYAVRASEKVDDDGTERLVKDYLEKLVQLPYSLPRLSTTEIETYMTLLFCQRHLSEADFGVCLTSCEANRTKNRYASFGYAGVRASLGGNDLKPELTQTLAFVAAAAPLITDGLKGNPRQVKRFLNALLLRKELARVAKLDNIRDDVLVKLMILEYVHTDLFTQLFTWQAQQNGHPKEIAELEAALAGPNGSANDEESAKKIDAKWGTKAARRWIAMEPLLMDVDLRDYFWVARDRLESTFAGISMVPPIVRAVLDGLISGLPPKRNAAMQSAQKLTEDELASLLSLLNQRVSRQRDDKAGYDSLRSLAEAGVNGAAQLLVKTLSEGPLEPIPATIGMDLVTLRNAKPELHGILDPVIARLRQSPTRIGRAVQGALKPRE